MKSPKLLPVTVSPQRKWKLLEPRTLTKQITLEEKIGMGGYGCVLSCEMAWRYHCREDLSLQ